MKNYPAESLSIPLRTDVRAGRATDSAARSARLSSSADARVPAILRDVKPPFLDGLTPPELNAVLAAAEHRRLQAKCAIINQDGPAEHLFLLLTGRARYFLLTETGRKVILLWIPPGEVFGSAALWAPPARYPASVETVSNSSALVWNRDTIRRLAMRYPRLFENAFSQASLYLAAYRAVHMALICETGRERFAHVLINLANGIGQKVAGGIELKIKNEELANEANITLFTASRLLTQWQRGGMIRKGRGKILLRSPELLLRHAETSLTA